MLANLFERREKNVSRSNANRILVSKEWLFVDSELGVVAIADGKDTGNRQTRH